MPTDPNGNFQPNIKSQFFEDHNKDISFFYTGKNNVLGRDYADSVIANTRNASYIRIGTISFDTTLQSTNENIIHEEFLLRIENYISSQYMANEVSVNIAGHVIGKRPNKTKFKCIITPEIEYLDIPEIMITEELTSNGYIIGIWLYTSGVKRIYITKLYSHARNSYPVNDEYIDSKYYIEFLKNSDMVYNVDTTNVKADITTNQFSIGTNIYATIDARLSKLESIKYPDIRFACVDTDSSWTPNTGAYASNHYQSIPIVDVDYSLSQSAPFLQIRDYAESVGLHVLEDGLYQIQYTWGICTASIIKNSDIEISLFKNNDAIPGTTIIKDSSNNQYLDTSGFSSAVTTLYLTSDDKIELKLKLISEFIGGIINKGSKIFITKLVQM